MLPDERKQKVVELITKDDGYSVDELATTLGYSKPTIRRDLDELADQNIIERTYGGAVPVVTRTQKYDQRKIHNQEAKAAIGERAVEEIHEGLTVCFDSGSTTFEVSKQVSDQLSFVAVTNNPSVGQQLAQDDARVELTGGRYRADHRTLVGPRAVRDIERLKFNLLFLGTEGIHPKTGLSTLNDRQARIKEVMIESAERVVLVADHSKIGKQNHVIFARLNDIDLYITDAGIPESLETALDDADIDTVSHLEDTEV